MYKYNSFQYLNRVKWWLRSKSLNPYIDFNSKNYLNEAQAYFQHIAEEIQSQLLTEFPHGQVLKANMEKADNNLTYNRLNYFI